MASLISEIWEGLREAGLPEVMLYLPDNSACRCHWDDTAEIGEVRVALLADQDRQIVRIVPVDTCVGIGVASPKGIDSSGYKLFVQKKLRQGAGEPELFVLPDPEPVPEPVRVATPLASSADATASADSRHPGEPVRGRHEVRSEPISIWRFAARTSMIDSRRPITNGRWYHRSSVLGPRSSITPSQDRGWNLAWTERRWLSSTRV